MAESFRAGDVEWEGRVVSAHHKLAATERTVLTEGDDPELRKRYDGEFHQALISSCGSRELMQTHAIVFDKYFRYALRYRGTRDDQPAQGAAGMRAEARHQERKAVLTEHINGCVAHAPVLLRRDRRAEEQSMHAQHSILHGQA